MNLCEVTWGCVESSERTFLVVLRMEFRQFIAASIVVDGLLQASDFFLGAFREQGELTGIDREHVAPQGGERTVHPLPLLHRLTQLGIVGHHGTTLRRPLQRPGSPQSS